MLLNTWKKQNGSKIYLHLRSTQYHLYSSEVDKVLIEALTTLHGIPITLTVIKDDNFTMKTPLEWQQAIYEEKLVQTYQEITTDNNIYMLKLLFDIEFDEEDVYLI